MVDREFITVTVTRHEELLAAERKLCALEAGGVDNWEGYSCVLEELYADEEED